LSNIRVGSQTGPARAHRIGLAAAWLGLLLVSAVHPEEPPGPLHVDGSLPGSDDLSAIASLGRFLVVASDEGAEIAVLEPTGEPNSYHARAETIRLDPSGGEIDIEAMARVEDELYVLGSHSVKRRRIDSDASRSRNRRRLAEVSDEPLRQRLYRLRLDPRTARPTTPPRWISLRPRLERDPIVGPFTRIPADENGVNLEGLAAEGSALYVGFRSPVLREGFVPVLRTSWDGASSGDLLLLDLDGRGIRALERVEGGFLLVARRERCEDDTDAIYFWDGADGVPGTDASPTRIRRLLELRPPPGAVTEALCVTAETPDHWEVVVVHDGVPGGYPLRLRVPRDHSTR